MKPNTDEIVRLAKERSEETRISVIKAIDRLKKGNVEITFAGVAKEAGVSRNYLYKNEEFRPLIEKLREQPVKKKRTKDTKDLIIETQKRKISKLTKELKKYESFNELEKKHEEALNEIEELKEQLRTAYEY